jgi:site-specific DNA-methyltransferase (adenine-specific)
MEWNSTLCGDNLTVMQQLIVRREEFDLIITDPPYGVGKDFGNDTDKLGAKEFIKFMSDRAALMVRLMAPNGSAICFTSQKYVARIQIALEESGMIFQRMMMWHYRNGMSRQVNSPVTEFEPFLWMTYGADYTYNGDDVRVPYKSDRVKTPVYKKNKSGEIKAWTPDPRGAKRGDVWEYPCLAGKLYADERTPHPTQKPESLITDLLRAYCPKGADGKYCGKVLDPFHGSGTVGVCCEKLNAQGHRIQWLGVELEQNWVDVSAKRLTAVSEMGEDYIL